MGNPAPLSRSLGTGARFHDVGAALSQRRHDLAGDARFAGLRAVARPHVAHRLERFVTDAPDEELARINALEFAERHDLGVEETIDAFVHAAMLGILELSWNTLCPGCAGVFEAGRDLRSMRETYSCALCGAGYEPTLDEMVEVTFSVTPAVRRIPAHDPDTLPFWQYYRQRFFSSGLRIPTGAAWDLYANELCLASREVAPREHVTLSLAAPAAFLILFDPVTHGATFLDAKGDPTTELQKVTVVFGAGGATPSSAALHPGPLELTIENRSERRLLAGVFVADDRFHAVLHERRPVLTAKRLFTNQTFRDFHPADAITVDQRLRITSLTFLFTDLKGSTALYDRVGDLAAFDLVRRHFRLLGDIVRAESGAVVKTIGDAVMATFAAPEDGLAAALAIRAAVESADAGPETLGVKMGLHEGPCLAVLSNDRLDYFGQTVNIAARVQALADDREVFTTPAIVESARCAGLLARARLTPVARRTSLRGVRNELTVYAIP